MTRASDKQLELDFESECKPNVQALESPDVPASAPIACFATHLRLRRVREEEAKDAKLLEQIASRVRNFK